MKNLFGILAILLTGLTFVSCEKDLSTGDNSGAVPNGVLLSGWVQNYMNNDTQSFSFNTANDTLITGAHGTQIFIPAYSIRYSSAMTATDTVFGSVDVTLIEIYDRSDMVRLNVPTEGYLSLFPPADSTSLLRTGGIYYLKLTRNGSTVYAPSGVTVLLPMDNTGNSLGSADEFNGSASGTDFYWSEDLLGGVVAGQDSFGNPAYEINDNSWGWTMAGEWAVPITGFPSSAFSNFRVQLPELYTPANCEVYLSIIGEQHALYPLNYQEGGFYTNRQKLIPIGTQYSVIAVGYIDGEIRMATTSGSVSAGSSAQATLEFADFEIMTDGALANAIDALP